MRVSFLSVPLSVLGLMTACGGSTTGSGSGSASASGTVGGVTLTVASVLSQTEPASTSSSCPSDPLPDGGSGCTSTSTGQVVALVLTNRADVTCATVQSSGSHLYASLDLLTLEVANQTAHVTTGTYAIVTSGNPNSGAAAVFETTNASCAQSLQVNGTAGSITLSKLSSTSVTGTYNVTFGTQGSFSGSFDVAFCDISGSTPPSADAGAQVCQP